MKPKSPLALASMNTQKELTKLLNSEENQTDNNKTSEVHQQDQIYFKVKNTPLKKKSGSNSMLTPAMKEMIKKELKGNTKPGCLKQGSLSTEMWNDICGRIHKAGLAIDAQPEAVVPKAKIKRMSMAQNKSN